MKISYADVNECCTEMTAIVTKMNNIVDDIKVSANSLSGGIWSGEAADNYCTKIQNLISSFDSISNQITTYISAINKCVENYKVLGDMIITGNIGDNINRVNSTKNVVMRVNGV